MTWAVVCVVGIVAVLAAAECFGSWWDRRLERTRAMLEADRRARRRIGP